LADCIVTITALALGTFTVYVPVVASGTIVRVWGCGNNPVSGSMAWPPSVVRVHGPASCAHCLWLCAYGCGFLENRTKRKTRWEPFCMVRVACNWLRQKHWTLNRPITGPV
jgi:hypothetical protein